MILIGLTLGIAMPLIANTVPIMKALSSTLRNALNLYRSVRSC